MTNTTVFVLVLTTQKKCVKRKIVLIVMDSDFVLVDQEPEEQVNRLRGGRPKGSHWEHFEQTNHTKDGHSRAVCKFCGESWYRGEKAILEGHIANHCKKAPPTIIREYLAKLTENSTPISSNNKKRKSNNDPGQITLNRSFNKIEELSSGFIDRLNRALLKFFVCSGIAFQIVENPFFVDFIKELNPSYTLPSREVLIGRLLEQELARVNNNVSKDLKDEKNLTLGKAFSNFK